jgi:hypothetical protein
LLLEDRPAVTVISTGGSNSLSARLRAPGENPARALARWRRSPPPWLSASYVEIDATEHSVAWEHRHTRLLMKLVSFEGLLVGVTPYRLTALFAQDGEGGSQITVEGDADELVRAGIEAAAEEFFAAA